MRRIRPSIWLFDPSGERKGIIDPIDPQCVFRESGLGTWSLSFDANHFLAKEVAPGWSVLITDGLVSMSGPIDKIGIERTATEGTYTISGKDEMVRLRDRIAYPAPGRDASAQTEVTHWSMKGAASNVIAALIESSIGFSALPYRKVKGARVSFQPGVGHQVTAHERFSNVLETVTKLSRLGGVTVSGLRDSSNIVYSIRVPRDLSRSVRFFSQSGTGATGSIDYEAPSVTAAIVAAQGEGVDRSITENTTTSEWGRRIEQLKDRRDTSETDAIDQTGAEALMEGAESASASFEVVESEGLLFGKDYALGDKVTFHMGTAVVSEPIRQATVKWDGHGRTVSLSLGDHEQEDDKNPAWVKYIKSLDSRLGGIESR